MLYVIDTEPWQEKEVQAQCLEHNVEYRPGFFFKLTCTKLASAILKHQIAAEHNIPVSALTQGIHGKPEFVDHPVYFNISHHGSIVIAVTSLTQPVGIDITDRVTPFSDEELLKLFTQLPPSHLQGFYWAARECFLKYTGEGVQEAPAKIQPPAHTAFPDLEKMGPLAVMPFIRVESQYARLFTIKNYSGAVIAPRSDVAEVCLFSNETE